MHAFAAADTVLLAQVGRRAIYSPYLDPPEPLLLESVTRAQIERLRDRVKGASPEERERARRQWDETARNIKRLHDAGVRIGIGSDGGGQGGDRFIGFTAHTELENMVAAGLTPAEAIAAATINGACAIRRADRIGSIEAGKQADIAVFDVRDYREIPYYAAVNCCVATFKRGELVYAKDRGMRSELQ